MGKRTKSKALAELTNNIIGVISTNASDAYSNNNKNHSDSDFTISPNSEGKEIALLKSPFIQMNRSRGKRIASVVPSRDLSAAKRSNKAIPMPRGTNRSKGKEAPLPSSCSTVLKQKKERAKETVVLSNDLQSQTRNKENEIVAMCSGYLFPQKFEENMKKGTAIISCPPILRTKPMRKRNNEINNTEPTKSWINPHPKKIKKRSITQEPKSEYCLPIDYCEKQRAYYKEIDDFELLEEEISSQDLNKC